MAFRKEGTIPSCKFHLLLLTFLLCVSSVFCVGDNDHKHGPHFHDVNYHAHDPKDEGHMKKRDHWLEELEKTPEQRDNDKHERRSEMIRHEARKERREHEYEEEHGRFSSDDEKAAANQKIVDAYEKKQLYLRKFESSLSLSLPLSLSPP